MPDQMWSWVLALTGVVGFVLEGRKIWWAWYINIASQIVWFAYAIITQQWGFLAGAIIYSIVFTVNAIKRTMEQFSTVAKDLIKEVFPSEMIVINEKMSSDQVDAMKLSIQHLARLKKSGEYGLR